MLSVYGSTDVPSTKQVRTDTVPVVSRANEGIEERAFYLFADVIRSRGRRFSRRRVVRLRHLSSMCAAAMSRVGLPLRNPSPSAALKKEADKSCSQCPRRDALNSTQAQGLGADG